MHASRLTASIGSPHLPSSHSAVCSIDICFFELLTGSFIGICKSNILWIR